MATALREEPLASIDFAQQHKHAETSVVEMVRPHVMQEPDVLDVPLEDDLQALVDKRCTLLEEELNRRLEERDRKLESLLPASEEAAQG